jgi:hypothetical protein
MSSPPPSDRAPGVPLDRLEADLPTTPEDVTRLRELRQRRRPVPLERMNDLAPPDWVPRPPRRSFGAGWEPFEL